MSFKKQLIRSIGHSTFFGWTVRLADRIPDLCGNLLRVLTYHRIDEIESRPDLDPSLISATPEQFARQIGWMCRDFDLVSLNDVLSAVTEGTSLPPRALLLTFDDAYQDFASNAWPILKSLAVPATLFVPTAFPDDSSRSFWWDELYQAISNARIGTELETPWGDFAIKCDTHRLGTFKRLKQLLKSLPQSSLQELVKCIVKASEGIKPKPAVLGWNELLRLNREGVALVPHTHTHPLLDQLTSEEVLTEIKRSHDELMQRTGKSMPVFVYPSGHFNQKTISLLRNESFELAFTTVRGIINLKADDPLKLRRINIARSTPDNLIRIQLAACSKVVNCKLPESFPISKSKPANTENAVRRPSLRLEPTPCNPARIQSSIIQLSVTSDGESCRRIQDSS